MKILHVTSRLFLGSAIAFGVFSMVPRLALEAQEPVRPVKCFDGNRNKCMETTVGGTTFYFYWI
jgi:hypothetical protein